ncbi:tRNA (guanosine(46)-N7)-methyltransferase TrmB [Gammaproteobacteria bacterium]|nr:tRNA (guanosine(46)-N7)-methyltransferase TrmB [Gammaproteobacteria bacterium]
MIESVISRGAHMSIGLEIGFGMGVEIVEWAELSPQTLIVGIELYKPGIGSLFSSLANKNIHNVLVFEGPAQLLVASIPDGSVQEVRIFFPDPWPKKKHAKRRLIQIPFIAQLARILVAGGELRIATDWEPYANWIEECVGQNQGFKPAFEGSLFRNQQRSVPTKFEKRGIDLAHEIFDFLYLRRD